MDPDCIVGRNKLKKEDLIIFKTTRGIMSIIINPESFENFLSEASLLPSELIAIKRSIGPKRNQFLHSVCTPKSFGMHCGLFH